MTVALALFTYAMALVLANLSVSHFGPASTPINAFFLIGLDLSLRDWLHERIRPLEMLGLVVGAGLISYGLDQSTGRIALASCAAFTLSGLADWGAFCAIPGPWIRRSMGSNVVGAGVDSILFPTIAFGVLMPWVVLAQFVAKVAGGAVWASLLNRWRKA